MPSRCPTIPKGSTRRPEANNLVGIMAAVTGRQRRGRAGRLRRPGVRHVQAGAGRRADRPIAPLRARLEEFRNDPARDRPDPRRRRRTSAGAWRSDTGRGLSRGRPVSLSFTLHRLFTAKRCKEATDFSGFSRVDGELSCVFVTCLSAAALGARRAVARRACATGLNTKVTRFQPAAIPAGYTFYVVPQGRHRGPAILSLCVDRSRSSSRPRAFVAAGTPHLADMLVRVDYGVDQGQVLNMSAIRSTDAELWLGDGRDGYGYGGYGGYRRSVGSTPSGAFIPAGPIIRAWRFATPFYYGWDDPFWYGGGYGGLMTATRSTSRTSTWTSSSAPPTRPCSKATPRRARRPTSSMPWSRT